MNDNREPTIVEVGADGVKLHGVYEDFRPAVQTAVATVNHVFSITENIVGLPADFINHYLGRFRDRYRVKMEAVPPEFRELPPVRVGCLVLNQVAYAAEEPKFQEMFADLLAAASDRRTRDNVHPSFATTINQLSPQDCELLVALTQSMVNVDYGPIADKIFGEDQEAAKTSIANLIRLGLAEWHYSDSRVSPFFDSGNFARSFESAAGSGGYRKEKTLTVDQAKRGLERASREMYEKLTKDVHRSSSPTAVNLTHYGSEFVTACLPR